MSTSFTVDFWGSHPDDNNDDCWYGFDFNTKEEALQKFNEQCTDMDVCCIEINGPDVYEVRYNRNFRPSTSDNLWRSEAAHQAGMVFGVQGYNDVMGY